MVFLHGGRRDRVDARRHGESLVLGDEGGLGVVGDHEPRIDAGVVGEESRQSARAGDVQHAVGATLGDRAEVGDGNGEEIEHVAERGTMKIAVRLDRTVL